MTDHTDILNTIQSLRTQLDSLEAQLRGGKAPVPSEQAAKPKRTLTDEQKAKMAAGRKAAAERRKAEKAAVEATPSDAEAKPKRTLSDEQKAKMAAGRKAAAERRKAEKDAAAATTTSGLKIEIPPPPADLELDQDGLHPLNIKGRKYLFDPESNGCWKRTAEGTKGDWAGVYDPEAKSLDTSIEDPNA